MVAKLEAMIARPGSTIVQTMESVPSSGILLAEVEPVGREGVTQDVFQVGHARKIPNPYESRDTCAVKRVSDCPRSLSRHFIRTIHQG